MGQPDAAHVDAAALLSIADQYAAAGALVATAVRTHLVHLTFDGATAGSGHAAAGDRLRRVLDDLVSGLLRWSSSTTEIASALRRSADRYMYADARASERLG